MPSEPYLSPPTWLKKIKKGRYTLEKSKTILRQQDLRVSFPNKASLHAYAKKLQWPWRMQWRPEQQKVIEAFFSDKHHEIVIQAIFGGGKTTIMLAIVCMLRLHNMCDIGNIFLCAFNVCIKNEIRKKLSTCRKANIRTFDSLVYTICKELGYPAADLIKTNFEGKRRFVLENLRDVVPMTHTQYVFVDECQDLEKACYKVFKARFPHAKLVFVGDVFQSVQKEPRESLLWKLIDRPPPERHCIFMTETPRVSKSVLHEVKDALVRFYPEMTSTIESWHSISTIKHEKNILWKGFVSYQDVYNDMLTFIQKHGEKRVMILTFSAAITVRGAMGDIARVRRFLAQNGIFTNSTHKRMDDDKVFLSTANSSKGLERDHVFCFLSFPLEKAFANFSNDLTMNLITVALTRAKKSVVFYSPLYSDRSSSSLLYYEKAPRPTILSTIQSSPTDETRFCADDSSDMRTVLEREWSTTEVLRQNILSFETREMLKNLAVPLTEPPSVTLHTKPPKHTEEQSTLSGLFFECMILSEWCNEHAILDYESTPSLHDMFSSLQNRVQRKIHTFKKRISRHAFHNTTTEKRINIALSHAKLQMLCNHKLCVKPDEEYITNLSEIWSSLQPFIKNLKARHTMDVHKIQFQHNLAMPYLTGIADAFLSYKDGDKKKCRVYELKASRSPEWKQNALLQAVMYGIMSNAYQTDIYLLNAFSPTLFGYRFKPNKNMRQIREKIIEDIQIWNLNCFLAKNNTRHADNKHDLMTDGLVIIDIDRVELFPSDTIDLDATTTIANTFKLLWFDSATRTKLYTFETFSDVLSFLAKAIPSKIYVGRFLCIDKEQYIKDIPDCKMLFTDNAEYELFVRHPVVEWFRLVRQIYNSVKMSNSKTNLDWSRGCSRLLIEVCLLLTQHNFV